MRVPCLVFTSSLVLLSAVVGCGSTPVTSECGDFAACTTGAGGATAATSTGTSMTTSGGGGSGAGGASTTSTGSSTSSTSAGTGGGSGVTCGGKQGMNCPATEYCDFPADACSFADETGTCKLRPTACPDLYAPTCACDGTVYGNSCEAAAAGVDVNLNGTCTSPDGMFACGSMFCGVGVSYCQRNNSDVGGVPSTYECKPLPPKCGKPATCACLANVTCGSMCAPSTDGAGLVVTCLGG